MPLSVKSRIIILLIKYQRFTLVQIYKSIHQKLAFTVNLTLSLKLSKIFF